MKRAVPIAVIVVAAAAVMVFLLSGRRSDQDRSDPATGGSSSTSAPRPAPTPTPSIASDSVSADHEQRERESLAAIAQDLSLSDPEKREVEAGLNDLQIGRRKLFEDLAARRINNEQVSRGLHELRAHMYLRIEAALGKPRALRLQERMRDDHR